MPAAVDGRTLPRQNVNVTRHQGFSKQTLSVLAVLCARPSAWQHGYAIARDTGLKSGTLYPILVRLADRGLMEACWEDEQPAGRPRRHLYRLTPEGLASAAAALADAIPEVRAQAVAALSPRRRLSTQG
jgi:PadR family transcriptional regulator PadR